MLRMLFKLTNVCVQQRVLPSGERGYLESMLRIFQRALHNESMDRLLVIDDDALFTCQFESDLVHPLPPPTVPCHTMRSMVPCIPF